MYDNTILNHANGGSLSTKASFRYGDVMAGTLLFPSRAHVLFGDVDGDDPTALLSARTRMHFVDNMYGRCRAVQLDFATRSRPAAGRRREETERTKVRGWAPEG